LAGIIVVCPVTGDREDVDEVFPILVIIQFTPVVVKVVVDDLCVA
jgi:hypothetical protein